MERKLLCVHPMSQQTKPESEHKFSLAMTLPTPNPPLALASSSGAPLPPQMVLLFGGLLT